MVDLDLFAPMSGLVLPLEDVPDPVFSQKLVGDGIAIDPTSGVLVAPCAGKVIQLHPSCHAVSIVTGSGVQVLLHVGLDTVQLKGEGFASKVRVGAQVEKGQTLIEFDSDLIARKAKSLISVMMITEAPPHQLQFAGQKLVRAGEDMIARLRAAETASAAMPDQRTEGRFAESRSAEEQGLGQRIESQPILVHLATGLHARPAALMVTAAKKYQSKIELKKGERRANARSVVSLLELEIGRGDSVQFVAQGEDAPAAVAELADLLGKLDEEAHPPKPKAEPPMASPSRSSENVIVGIGASPGLALGRVHQMQTESFEIPENSSSSTEEENTRLAKALRQASGELDAVRMQVRSKTDATQAAIFGAHQELLEDPDLIDQATDLIENGKTAAFAWNQAILDHAERLSHLNNELMAQRANDLRDIGRRVLRLILGKIAPEPVALGHDSILIAEDLTPSDTVQLSRGKILGFCTVKGGATSHVAILARSLGLPALAGVEARALDIPEGIEVVLDGDQGEIRLRPTEDEKKVIRFRQEEYFEQRRMAMTNSEHPALTRDGHYVEVAANIGGLADARRAVEMGCDGVGLLRSEFLFLERATAPSEEEQYLVYQQIADILGARPLVIRTLDVGGDKPLQYLPIPPEENPFLGLRGLRVGFLRPEILREQLRAILRVKTSGSLHVMFPMVSTVEEFSAAKAILEEERNRLGMAPIEVGIMIEVPSAALMAEAFAREVDFFSVGTNDLTQYTLAIDRGHRELASRADALHPSVLKLIQMTVQAAHKYGKWVGVCGGLASEAQAVPLLVGMGVDELSVSIPAIPMVKAQIRAITLKESRDFTEQALSLSSNKEVRALPIRN